MYRKRLSLCLVLLSWLLYNGGVAMASSESSSSSKDLDQTPTWAVAGVCTVFILISIILEKSLHKIGTVWYQFETPFNFNCNCLILRFIINLTVFFSNLICFNENFVFMLFCCM
jgi:hypothetical protein